MSESQTGSGKTPSSARTIKLAELIDVLGTVFTGELLGHLEQMTGGTNRAETQKIRDIQLAIIQHKKDKIS